MTYERRHYRRGPRRHRSRASLPATQIPRRLPPQLGLSRHRLSSSRPARRSYVANAYQHGGSTHKVRGPLGSFIRHRRSHAPVGLRRPAGQSDPLRPSACYHRLPYHRRLDSSIWPRPLAAAMVGRSGSSCRSTRPGHTPCQRRRRRVREAGASPEVEPCATGSFNVP